ncbi:hypothetical protein [Roseinatronobacter sp.]|uniref:hypothetical protein n=1 Tax=Roseinatronobacter sp. TaxID=1945755 RepID=UPI0025D456C2|nr:hypothetical protein [Roseibaca sp.]
MADTETVEITLTPGVMLLVAEIIRHERGAPTRCPEQAERAVADALLGLSNPDNGELHA